MRWKWIVCVREGSSAETHTCGFAKDFKLPAGAPDADLKPMGREYRIMLKEATMRGRASGGHAWSRG